MRRELTQEEKEAQQRLKEIWKKKKKALKLSQEELALKCGWSGQSAFSQYYHGRIPLNIKATIKIAKVLEVEPTEIMPEIANILSEQKIETYKIKEPNRAAQMEKEELSKEAIDFAKAFDELPPDQRAVLIATAKAFMDSSKKSTTEKAA